MPQSKGGKVIQSVQRAIDILNCFESSNTELTLSQISLRLALNKSTVHGILNTLHNNGYIRQNSEGRYLLGQALFNKSALARNTNRSLYLDIAKPHLVRLSNRMRATANLFVIDEDIPMVLHQTQPTNSIYIVQHVSSNDPLYCTASGKLALAHMPPEKLRRYLAVTRLAPTSPFTITDPVELEHNLDQIRRDGYAYEREELGEGVSAISAPIYDRSQALFGTMSITGMTFHVVNNDQEIISVLKETSAAITREMFG